MVSQIPSLTIVYSSVYSGPVQRRHQITDDREFPAQKDSNAENATIW